MQNTLSPSPATPSDNDYSYLLTLHFWSKQAYVQIKSGNILTALLDQRAPSSDLLHCQRLLLPLKRYRGIARSSQGPQDHRRLCYSICCGINLFCRPHSASPLSQNWGRSKLKLLQRTNVSFNVPCVIIILLYMQGGILNLSENENNDSGTGQDDTEEQLYQVQT